MKPVPHRAHGPGRGTAGCPAACSRDMSAMTSSFSNRTFSALETVALHIVASPAAVAMPPAPGMTARRTSSLLNPRTLTCEVGGKGRAESHRPFVDRGEEGIDVLAAEVAARVAVRSRRAEQREEARARVSRSRHRMPSGREIRSAKNSSTPLPEIRRMSSPTSQPNVNAWY